eukprot:scaffold109328_cov18-Prasinocladus_malaysianus.AAC.1
MRNQGLWVLGNLALWPAVLRRPPASHLLPLLSGPPGPVSQAPGRPVPAPPQVLLPWGRPPLPPATGRPLASPALRLSLQADPKPAAPGLRAHKHRIDSP